MDEKKLKFGLMIVAAVFLVSLTVLVNVLIGNEVKKASFIGLDSDHLRTISVSGEGKVYVTPDTAKVSFSVITTDSDSETALDENNERASEVVNYLKGQGIEEENIQTTGLNVRPLYDREIERRELEERTIGYEVTNRVEVEFKELERASTIIDGAVRAGANSVDSFQFIVNEEDDFRAEAREKAIKEAKEKAEATASSLGVKVGRVIEFSESRDYTPLVMERGMGDVAMEEPAPDMPLEPGENEITVNVSIDYEII